MRSKYKAVPVALVATFVLSAVMASSAFASTEWYTEAPEWARSGVPLTEAAITWSPNSVLTITDPARGPAGVKVTVACETTSEGRAGGGAVDEERHWTPASCKTTVGNEECPVPTVEAVHLPWHSELGYSKGTLYDTITSGGSGEPGFSVTCKTRIGIKSDVCQSAALRSIVTDVAGGVQAKFDNEPGTIKCTENNKHTGEIEDTRHMEGSCVPCGTLEAGALKKLTSALTVKAKGELTVRDTKSLLGELSVKCTFETEGTIEAEGKGKITLFKPSNCTHGGACSSLNSVTSVNLPWGTELSALSESDLRDSIVSGGSGTPGWDFECETGVGRKNDICNLNTSLRAVNGPEGNVEIFFDPESKRTGCSLGGNEAGKWEGTLTIVHPETVNGIRVK